MEGLRYQLKSVRRDKMCILTFLLPVVAGIAVHLLSGVSFQSIGENIFGVWESHIDADTVEWLQANGTVAQYETLDELRAAVNEPSTQMIGVLQTENGIQTFISGDELEMNVCIADTLPQIYENQREPLPVEQTLIHMKTGNEGLKSLLIAITLVTAMFMGCTFNAMNIITEKEDGVAFVNEILPMTRSQYIIQKLSVGFICGCLSSILTACICFRITLHSAALMLVLIVLSAFVSALAGLFIGRASNGLMAGVVYIKIVMLLFIAVPILGFLVGINQPLLSAACYLVPSQATFEGIMELANGTAATAVKDIVILAAHCAFWLLLYMLTARINLQSYKNVKYHPTKE